MMNKKYTISRCHVGIIRIYDFGDHITLNIYSMLPHSPEYKPERLWIGSVNRNGTRCKLLMDYLRNSDELKNKLIWTETSEFFNMDEKYLDELLVIIEKFIKN